MGDFVTRDELKHALQVERSHTKEMIDEAIEDATQRQAGVWSDIRASLRDIQRDSAMTAVRLENFEGRFDDRFNKLEKLFDTHEAPIRRLRAYETLAVGGINVVGSLPVFGWLKRAFAAAVVVGGGAGLGGFLFLMVTR